MGSYKNTQMVTDSVEKWQHLFGSIVLIKNYSKLEINYLIIMQDKTLEHFHKRCALKS